MSSEDAVEEASSILMKVKKVDIRGKLNELGILDKAKQLKAYSENTIWNEIQKHFPGLTMDALLEGWIPISLDLLQQHVSEYILSSPEFKDIRGLQLRADDGVLHMLLDWRTAIKNASIKLDYTIESFALNKEKDEVVLHCQTKLYEEPNRVNTILQAVFQKAVELALKIKGASNKQADNQAVVTKFFPKITLHMMQIPEIKQIAEKQYLGFTLLDVVHLTDARFRPGALEIRVQPVGLVKNLVDVVRRKQIAS
ncbi:hypothetical protein [Desulfatirhabdium butyrativorans]|uniref:hypothetical protein n=1 Tax=Desulfatirhabdium butyrativorans TaxID=340467 RepID=UPI0004160420|nr:hypothetical protein [Desulfatirhabdium butyrativorans]